MKWETSIQEGWTSTNKDKPSKTAETTSKEPQQHQLYFSKEKRRGKVVTIVQPFHLSKADLSTLLKILKKKLGTGGTLKENRLEFQGDTPTQIQAQLMLLDYSFKH
ncbi:MAG: translation initiation factor [Sulfurovum sp.]|nr:translation initiation factor [Sulfurovum sp.]